MDPQASPLPESKIKSSPDWFLAGLMLVIGLVIGFLLAEFVQLPKPMSQLNNIVVEATPTPILLSTPEMKFDSKEYVDNEFGFKFKYPSSFSNIGLVSGPSTGVSKFLVTFSDPKTIKEGTDAPFSGLSVYVVTDIKARNFDEFIDNEIREIKKSDFSQGINVSKSPIMNPNVIGISIPVSPTTKLYYLPFDNNKKVVVLSQIFAEENFLFTFDQVVLSSFKFINQVDVSMWKTFSNGFLSFNYPASAILNGTSMITSEKPKYQIYTTRSSSSEPGLSNECMSEFKTSKVNNLLVRYFSGINDRNNAMCGTDHKDEREVWIVKPEDKYKGTLIHYLVNDQVEVEKLLDQIIASFKFL